MKEKKQDSLFSRDTRSTGTLFKKMVTVNAIKPFIIPEPAENLDSSEFLRSAGEGQKRAKLAAGKSCINRCHGDDNLPLTGARLVNNLLNIGMRSGKCCIYLTAKRLCGA